MKASLIATDAQASRARIVPISRVRALTAAYAAHVSLSACQ